MMKYVVCAILLLSPAARCENLIDVSIVMTAPADKYATGSIKGLFRRSLADTGIGVEEMSVERIGSYSDYLTIRRMIEDPQSLLSSNTNTIVYYVADDDAAGGARSYVVHESDPARANEVSGIAIRHRTKDNELETVVDDLEGADTEQAFRLKSSDVGDFTFTPNPTFAIESYQLLYGGSELTQDWVEWPGARARFLVNLRGFPTTHDTVTGLSPFQRLKKDLQSQTNRVEFTAESSSTLSLADALYEKTVISPRPKAANGLVTCVIPAGDITTAWMLVTLTPRQQQEVVGEIKDGIRNDKIDEEQLAEGLRNGKPVLGFPVIPAGGNRALDGKAGPAWFELKRVGDSLQLSLRIRNPGDWKRRFRGAGAGQCITVFEQDGLLVRGPEGDFWRTQPVIDW